MIGTIKQFFDTHLNLGHESSQESKDHALQLASAALLIEMTKVDNEIKEEEQQIVTNAIKKTFELSSDETTELLALAEQEAQQSTCYYEFTSLINREFSQEQKIKLVEQMWLVAFADKELEKHEEHLVRKVSDLLYVSHKDFITAKHRAQQT
ncbi:MAG: TerB family tellurite resistance protein [Gammaproteobacteria bacterium]|nr:TerB family tellurite resistance protein [Gammaproteobacteria bacterium]